MKFSKKAVSVCAVAMSTCFMAQVPQVVDAATSPFAPVCLLRILWRPHLCNQAR